MKYTDYKIQRVRKIGNYYEVYARFYEGEYFQEKNDDGRMELIYKRQKVLKDVEIKTSTGNFETILLKLERQLGKDEARTPIDKQNYEEKINKFRGKQVV